MNKGINFNSREENNTTSLTGYPSKDNPHAKNATYFEKHPIIPNTNIYMTLKLLSNFYLDKPAVNCLTLEASYRQLLEDSVTISLALKELGVKKGEIIAVCMPNFYQALATFFACNRIGAITTFLDAKSSLEDISFYLNEFSSPIFINYDRSDEENKKLKNNSKVRHIITLNRGNVVELNLNRNYKITSNENRIDFNSLGDIAKYRKIKLEPIHSGKEDALILFTSGSTGKPKSVVLTNKNILAAEIYAKNTSHTENITGPKTLTCVPFSYPYGLVTSALTTLLWGKEAILAPDISKYTINDYYKKEPNIIFGSPALLDLTINNIDENLDLSMVTHFISGGDFLTPQHYKRGMEFFQKHHANVELGNGFGNAETVSIGSTPVGVPLKAETAGKLLVGSKAMIIDPETYEEKKYGENGLLLISGKHVFKGYYQNEELTQKSKVTINGTEYYNTGTLGYIDQDGYFTPTGRKSRFYIMSSLNKVYCDNVQNILSSFDCIKSCAVVKVPDEEELFVNKAYVVLNKDYVPDQNTLQHIAELCNQPTIISNDKTAQLKPYEIPKYIEFVDRLPRISGSEKIDYPYLEEDAKRKQEQGKVLQLTKKA